MQLARRFALLATFRLVVIHYAHLLRKITEINEGPGITTLIGHKIKFLIRSATILLSLVLVVLALFLLSQPGAGRVYRYRSDQYGLQGNTGLVLRNRDCLILSRSEADIGKMEAAPGSESRPSSRERTESGRQATGSATIWLIPKPAW